MTAADSAARRRMRQLERSGRVDPAAPAGAVLFAGGERRGSGGGRDGAITVSLVAPEVGIEIRADVLLDVARAELLQRYREQIMRGVRPDTGAAQPELTERAKKAKGRKGQVRGFNTGQLADGLRSPKMTGTTASARARVLPPTNRNVFIANEAKRGIFYLLIGPQHEQALQETVDAFIDKVIADAAGLRGVTMAPRDTRDSGGE